MTRVNAVRAGVHSLALHLCLTLPNQGHYSLCINSLKLRLRWFDLHVLWLSSIHDYKRLFEVKPPGNSFVRTCSQIYGFGADLSASSISAVEMRKALHVEYVVINCCQLWDVTSITGDISSGTCQVFASRFAYVLWSLCSHNRNGSDKKCSLINRKTCVSRTSKRWKRHGACADHDKWNKTPPKWNVNSSVKAALYVRWVDVSISNCLRRTKWIFMHIAFPSRSNVPSWRFVKTTSIQQTDLKYFSLNTCTN